MLHEVEDLDVDNEAVSHCIESMTGHAHVQCSAVQTDSSRPVDLDSRVHLGESIFRVLRGQIRRD